MDDLVPLQLVTVRRSIHSLLKQTAERQVKVCRRDYSCLSIFRRLKWSQPC